jgi:hypothetical protein
VCANSSISARKLGIENADIDDLFRKGDGDDDDNPFNTKRVESFCNTISIAPKALLELGNNIQHISNRRIGDKPYSYTDSYSINLFRSVRQGWNAVDGVVVQSTQDTEQRYNIFPRWLNNSCAVDVVLFVAIMLDVGRCQIDQISKN